MLYDLTIGFLDRIRLKELMKIVLLSLVAALFVGVESRADDWIIDSADDWRQNIQSSEGCKVAEGSVSPEEKTATIATKVHASDVKRSAKSLLVTQSAIWQNWNPTPNLGPKNLGDAPVMLTLGPGNYWMFGRYGGAKKKQKKKPFEPKEAKLDGFDMPLQTTRYANQFDAPGGLKPRKGGYHAWQSRDMKNWVHHGPVTEGFSRWVTSAEFVDGKALIYYDFPNDQDPHVYVDDDLFDGEPGKNMGMAVKDPSHGLSLIHI